MSGLRHHGAGLLAGLLAWGLGAATAQATCMGLPDTLTLRGPTCAPLTCAPQGLGALRLDAALPLTFTYTRGAMCCAGSSESCSRQIAPFTPAMILDLAGRAQGRQPNGVRIRALLRAGGVRRHDPARPPRGRHHMRGRAAAGADRRPAPAGHDQAGRPHPAHHPRGRPVRMRVPGLILRTTGMICVGEQACFGALAAEAGLFEAKGPLTPRGWAALYLWLAGEAPTRFVDRDARDATIQPAERAREDAQHVSLSACYQVAGDKRTRCFAQRFTHPDAP